MVQIGSILFSILVAIAASVPVVVGAPASRANEPAASSDEVSYLTRWVSFAAAAYCDLSSWNCGKNCNGANKNTILLKQFDTQSNYDTEGYIAVNPDFKSIIVAYRGTSDLGSVLTDAQAFFKDYPSVSGAKVHNGFLGGYLASKPLVTPYITEALQKYPDYDLHFIGHSLGGANALLAAVDVAETMKLPKGKIKVTTYGQPRVGNEKFVQYVDTLGFDFRRVVHSHDLVPHVPPRLLSYRHNGIEFWIRPPLFGGGIVKCLVPDEDTACSNRATPFVEVLSHVSYFDTVMVLSCLAP